MLEYEQKAKAKGFSLIIGVDEAGRGPLAGPVTACAVSVRTYPFTNKIRDSKKLSAIERERAFFEILDKAYVGIGIMSEAVIDAINILRATHAAMSWAVRDVICRISKIKNPQPNFNEQVCLLIDGNSFKSDLDYRYETIIRGDEFVFSIACASIVAKVVRDRIMNIYDKVFPLYGFSRHKGYPTPEHRQILKKAGPSLIHRKTFNLNS